MRPRPLGLLLVFIVATLAPAQNAGSARSVVPDLEQRLRALTPEAPRAYLLLGEEVIHEMRGREARELGRTLLVLAFELDRRRAEPEGVGASTCYALASIAGSGPEARWLRALAQAIEAREPLMDIASDRVEADAPSEDEARVVLAEAIALARAEKGQGVERMLEQPEVAEVLEDVESRLGGADRMFERAARRPVCPECGNRRTVPSLDRDGDPLILCPTCNGNPGARLSDEEFLDSLAVEADLLDARIETWSGQLLIDGGAPAREADISSLSGFYGVDASRPYWSPAGGVLGTWVEEPDATSSP